MTKEEFAPKDADEITVREVIIDFQRWIRFLWSKKRILIIAGLLGSLLGLLYAYLKKPVYIATTTFVVESPDSKGGLSKFANIAAVAGIDLGGSGGGLFQGDNILELYKSRTMLTQALLSQVSLDSNELLIERYLSFSGLKESWRDRPDLLALNFGQAPTALDSQTLRMRDSVLTVVTNVIRDNVLTVDKPDKKLSIVKVDVASPDEAFSKAFNEYLVSGVNEFYVRTKTKKSTRMINILQQKIDSVRNIMTGAIYSAARASDATPNLNPTRQVHRVAPAQEAQFSVETNKVMLGQLVQNLELTKLALAQEEPLIQLIDRPVYPLKKDQISIVKGTILGGILAGLIALIFLTIFRWYKNLLSEN